MGETERHSRRPVRRYFREQCIFEYIEALWYSRNVELPNCSSLMAVFETFQL